MINLGNVSTETQSKKPAGSELTNQTQALPV